MTIIIISFFIICRNTPTPIWVYKYNDNPWKAPIVKPATLTIRTT